MLKAIARRLPLLRLLACRDRMVRIVLFGSALTLAVLATAVLPQRANAQIFTASKKFCTGVPTAMGGDIDPYACQLAPVVGDGVQSFYVITVTNPPGQLAQSITLTDNFPPGFQPPNVISCTDQSGRSVNVSPANPYAFTLGTNTTTPTASWTVTCAITGTFSSASNVLNTTQSNTGTLTSGNGTSFVATNVSTNTVNTFVAANTPLGTDLSVSKTASATSVTLSGGTSTTAPSATVTYTITVANNHANAQSVSLPNNFVLHDTLALLPNSVPLQAQLTSAACQTNSSATSNLAFPSGPGPVVTISPGSPPVDFFDWGFPAGSPGTIAAGGTITCTVTVQVSSIPGLNCYIQSGADGLINRAFFTLSNLTTSSSGVTTGSTYSDIDPANDTASASLSVNTGATQQLANCGTAQLDIQKTQLSPLGVLPWPSTVNYQITIKNNSIPPQPITIPIGGLQDLVTQGSGTPPFVSTFISEAGVAGTATASTISYASYGQSQLAWQSSGSVTLLPGQSITMQIAFQYSDPDCTTVPNVNPEPIINTAVITYQATPVGASTGVETYTQSASVVTDMQPQPACPFAVTKALSSGGPNVQFGVPLTYNVTFSNNGAATAVGTVLDTIRITDPTYGTPVPVTGSWTCSTSTGVTGFPAIGSIAAQASYTPVPPQGWPIFQFTNLYFPQNSTLTCTVTITVQRPAYNNQNCSAVPAYFENLALMDVTNPYNPNVLWPPSGTYATGASSPPQTTNWATVDSQLPQCYDVVINKSASIDGATPAWTTPSGPPVNYTITVTNTGTGSAALTGSVGTGSIWNGLLLTDTVVDPYAADYAGNIFSLTDAPTCPETWCAPLTPTGSSSSPSPSTAGVAILGVTSSGNWNLTLQPPFVPGTTINNCATVTPQGTFAGAGWYPNYDPTISPTNPPTACAHVPVLQTANLDVVKTVVNDTGKQISLPPTTFTGGVRCLQFPLLPALTPGDGNWTQTIPATTLSNGQSVSSATPAQVQNVPIAPLPQVETCVVIETTPSVPAAAELACGGFAYWDTTTIAPQSVAITTVGATYTVTVTNTLHCMPSAILNVTKTIVNDTGKPLTVAASPPMTFTANVSCGPTSLPSSVSLPLTVGPAPWPDGGSVNSPTAQVQVPVVAGENCAVTEPGLAAVPVAADQACSGPVRGVAAWYTTITPAQPIAVTTPNTTYAITITNTLRCQSMLSVTKTVSPDPAGIAANTLFPIAVSCTDPTGNKATYNLSVPGNKTAPSINNMMVGTVCTFAETPLPPFTYNGQPCTWQTPAYAPQSVTIGIVPANEKVTNSYTCQSMLSVTKTVSPDPAGIAAKTLFPITVSCTDPTGNKTTYNLSVTGNTAAPSINNLMVGTVCTFAEKPLPPFTYNGQPCTWQTPKYSLQSVTIGLTPAQNSETMTNSYICQSMLSVTKTVSPDPAGIAAITLFPIAVSCTDPTGNKTTYNLSVAGNTTAPSISNLMVGTVCTFAETPLPAPFTYNGQTCTWQTPEYSSHSVMVGLTPAQNSETVTNSYICRQAATLQVIKTITENTDTTIKFPALIFPVNVTCTSLSVNLNLTIAPATLAAQGPPGGAQGGPGFPEELSSPASQVPVAVGDLCTVTETTPLPAMPPLNCHGLPAYWATAITPPQPMLITAGPNTVTVTNTIECPLTVSKNVAIVGPVGRASDPANIAGQTTVTVNMKCTDSSGNVVATHSWSLSGNTTSAPFPNLPLGISCTFAESTPTPASFQYNNQTCIWEAPLYSPQPMAIGWSSLNNEIVTNFYICLKPQPNSLTIIKNIIPKTILPPPPVTYVFGIECNSSTPFNTTISIPFDPNSISPIGSDLYQITGTANNLPPGAKCTVTEQDPNIPGCPQFSPTYSPPNGQVVIQALPAVNTITVTNSVCASATLRQSPVEELKQGACSSPMIPNAAGTACMCPQGTVQNGQNCVRPITCKSPQVPNAAGTACGCPPPMISGPAPAAGALGGTLAGAAPNSCVCPNGMQLQGNKCVPIPNKCPPPMIPGPAAAGGAPVVAGTGVGTAGTTCVCPPNTVQQGNKCVQPTACKPPMIPNPAAAFANAAGAACVCPQGTVQNGQDCVASTACKPPMIPNPACAAVKCTGAACVCPQGTVQRGQNCVPPMTCKAPLVANAAGTACVCPQGTVQKGQQCVSSGPGGGGPAPGGGGRQ